MNQIAFLLLSCDKYSDLWDPYAQLFERYWSDCPFDKYFATNQIPFDKYRFQPILMGEDKTWSKGLMIALNILKDRYDYVFITLEDLFIIKDVDTTFIIESIRSFVNLNGNYLKLYTKRKPYTRSNNYFGAIKDNIPYRHNCVYSVWKIDILLSVLIPTENAWEFEKIGERRTSELEKFYCSNKNCFDISNGVIKGKWLKRELKKIKKEIPDLVVTREILSDLEEKYLCMRKFMLGIFLKYIPTRFQKALIKWMRTMN